MLIVLVPEAVSSYSFKFFTNSSGHFVVTSRDGKRVYQFSRMMSYCSQTNMAFS